jgi:hypothetical protein
VFLKPLFRLVGYTTRVFIWVIEHIHLDIQEELVVFGEQCDDGNFKVAR